MSNGGGSSNGGGGGGSAGGGGGTGCAGSPGAKADAAVAILASAAYLWDFFVATDSHASLGLARDTSAYATLRGLLVENAEGLGGGGGGGGSERVCGGGSGGGGSGGGEGRRGGGVAAGIAACSPRGGDATVDLAVSVGKALIDVQRQVLRKV